MRPVSFFFRQGLQIRAIPLLLLKTNDVTDKERNKKSKFLSLVLRHKPEEIGLVLDGEGWAVTDELLAKADISLEELKEIVTTNEKQRFAFSNDQSKIRASQGHSVSVDLALQPALPPEILYHGTADRNIPSILEKGLVKGSRNHVHLSANIETAITVGRRYGKPVVLEIRARQMAAEGHEFFISENGVWLTDSVPAGFIAPLEFRS